MEIQSHTLQVSRTAHYFTRGSLTKHTSTIWMVCHGYGQTADHFINKFVSLPENHFVVAPEALNSFYWHDQERRPVASWMTSRYREDEILDYLAYLQNLATKLVAIAPSARVVVFGFSQGCATAARFAYHGNMHVDDLVLWAGDFPRDIDYSAKGIKQIWHVLGDEDYYITPSRYLIEKQFAKETDLPVHFMTFAGPHRIDRTAFKLLSDLMKLD